MINSTATTLKCPEHLTWLYAGIDYTLEGNGGPDCAKYLSPTHRLVETGIILLASVLEIVWALKRIKYNDVSSVCPVFIPVSSKHSAQDNNKKTSKLHSLDRPLLKTVLLVFTSLIFGIEIGFKFSTNTLIYLLNPCHLLTISLIFLLSVDEKKHSNIVTFIFRVHLHLLSGALLAILLPVVNTRFLSFEKHSYWVHHLLIYLGPGYLLTLGGPFTAEPLGCRFWPVLSIGIGFFYHFTVLQGLGLLTHANLNNMLCPALSDPFEGPYYRMWAFAHQHLLNLIHGKLYQLATFAVASCLYRARSCCKIELHSNGEVFLDKNGNRHLDLQGKKAA